MNTSFELLDYTVFAVYAVIILGVGLWVSRNKEGKLRVRKIIFWLVSPCPGGP